MLYAVIGTDKPDSLQQRLSARPDHLARLNELKNAGRLLLAGPFPAIDSDDPGLCARVRQRRTGHAVVHGQL